MRLEVNNLNKRYRAIHAVKQLNFHVESGEIFALLGPNGAGKSSTIRMLTGLATVDEGQVSFSSEAHTTSALTSEQFGYLPEERGLFQEAKILNTLVHIGQLKGMTKRDAETEAKAWLKELELEERMQDKLKTLSKGNQQKVQLVSCIIHKPAIAFLDEPFSGLDPINQEKVIGILQKLKAQGTTIILSAHQMSLVEKLADRFLLMNLGSPLLYGAMADIRQQVALGNKVIIDITSGQETALHDFVATQKTNVEKVEPESDQQFCITLNKDCDLANWLSLLLQNLSIQNLQVVQPSLHDLYIHAVEQAK